MSTETNISKTKAKATGKKKYIAKDQSPPAAATPNGNRRIRQIEPDPESFRGSPNQGAKGKR